MYYVKKIDKKPSLKRKAIGIYSYNPIKMSRFSVLKSNKVLAPPASPIQVPSPSSPAIATASPEPRRFGFRSSSLLSMQSDGAGSRPDSRQDLSRPDTPQTPTSFEPRKSSGVFRKPTPVTPTEVSPTAAPEQPTEKRQFGLRKVPSNESIPSVANEQPTEKRQFGLRKVASNESIPSEVSERRVFDKSVFGSNTGMSAFSSKPRVKREDADVMPKELEITDENSFIFKAIARKYGIAIKEEIKLESMIQFPSLGPAPSPITVAAPSPSSSTMDIDEATAPAPVAPKKNMWSAIAAKKADEPKEEKAPEVPTENVIMMDDLRALINSAAINNLYKTSNTYCHDWISPSPSEMREFEPEPDVPAPVVPAPVVPTPTPAPVAKKAPVAKESDEPLTGKQKALNSFFKKKK